MFETLNYAFFDIVPNRTFRIKSGFFGFANGRSKRGFVGDNMGISAHTILFSTFHHTGSEGTTTKKNKNKA